MKSNTPPPYNLRSIQKKRSISGRKCYLQNLSEDRSPVAFSPRVCLERLNLLDCHDIPNRRFYLENGKIKVQGSELNSNKKFLKVICLTLLIIALVSCRESLQTSGIILIRKFSEILPSLQNYYTDAVKYDENNVKLFKSKKQNTNKDEGKSVLQTPNENSTIRQDNIEIRQLVREYFIEIKKKNQIPNKQTSPQSFIEEQCRRDVQDSPVSKKKVFDNVTFHDMTNFTDYALESQGAKILTVFNTTLYGTITVKYLNINLWPEVSDFLMNYLKCFSVNGPNSILMPWKKPGDCWAFMGSYGRVKFRLSEEVIITAITVEHIPKEIVSEGNIQSAPKQFSLSAVDESGKKATFLGRFEYDISGPAAQTFFIQPKVEIPFGIVEVVFESNHGNEKYTCIYKIRIHSRK